MFHRNPRVRAFQRCVRASISADARPSRVPCGLLMSILLLSASAALGQRPNGMDTSMWDGDLTVQTWQGVYNAGYVFAFVKATEGVGYTDPEFFDNVTRAPQAGILTGFYHFAQPVYNTATAEADYFVGVAGPYISGGYLRPVLDLERGSELGATALSNWANAWMNRVEQLTGVEPLIYCNTNYATNYLNSTVASRDLWIAQYLSNPDPQNDEPSIGIFPTWLIWQWTANCSIPGIPGSADCNVFNGTLAQLDDLVIPGGTAPPFIVESRSGGQNYASYSETGTWSNGSSKSTAPGVTSGIGHRWCTINSTAKTAVFRFTPSTTGIYEVFTTNTTTSNSGNPLVHKVTHAGGTTNVGVCQNTTCNPNAVNVWYSLGQYTLNAGTQYTVTLDGSTGGGSAPANNAGRSDAIKWTFVTGSSSPTIDRSPSTLSPSCTQGQNASNQTFTVANSGSGTLSYSISDNVSWLSCSPTSGTSTGEADTITVTYATSGLTAGTYNATITISDPNATNNPQTIAVTLTVSSGATIVLNDTFDSYAGQSNFTAAWPISLSPGGSLSTAAYFSSPKSIYFSTSAARNYRNFTASSGTNATPIVWSIRIYDNNTSNLDRQWCELLDASPSITQLVAMGKSNIVEAMRTYYAARVAYAPGPGWITLNDAGAPARSVGWHEIKAVIKSTAIDFYVDGVLARANVAYASSQGQFTFDQARIGSGYSSTSAAYFDDVKVQVGQ